MHDDHDLDGDPVLGAVIRELQAPIHPRSRAPDQALATLVSERRRRMWWPIAAVLLLALGLPLARSRAEEARPVRFALRASPSARVALIGDFNDWDPSRSPLRQRQGEWTATVRLKPGRYSYSFVVNGSRWVADPHGAAVHDDDFGTPTSVITVAR
jgi:hypothetical protein